MTITGIPTIENRGPVPASLERAYLLHKDRLLTLAAAIVGDRALAEDVVHDVFAVLARDGQALDACASSGAYLTAAARNRAISLLRSRKVHVAHAGAVAAATVPAVVDPGDAAAQSEEDDRLLRLVAALPQDLRQALALRVWGELGFREIAVVENVSKSTARARYAEALRRLKMQFGARSND